MRINQSLNLGCQIYKIAICNHSNYDVKISWTILRLKG